MLLKNGLFYFINRFEPDRVWVAFDTGRSWRKDETSIYKEQRKEAREKQASLIDWEGFYSFLNEFKIEIETIFPFYILAINRLEADDIAAYLCKTLPEDEEKIVCSDDGDYIQLIKYKNTSVFSSRKNKFVDCSSPEHFLTVKILIGDKSDNIPPVRKGVAEKKAEKMILSGEFETLLNEKDRDGNPTEFRRNYDRNKKLIDLDFTPDSLLDKLQSYIDHYEMPDGSMMFKYFIQHKLRDMISDIEKYRKILSKLTPKKEIEDGISGLFSK